MPFKSKVVIDCKGHLLGRLATIVAKQLLMGQTIVAVRCELLNVSGSIYRNRMRMGYKKQKTNNSNPRRGGPYHFRAPSKIFWRTVRGCLPAKTSRGAKALSLLKTFDGIPTPYQNEKRLVVPSALRYMRLGINRKYVILGKLATEFGWTYGEIVNKFEEVRKLKGAERYQRSLGLAKLRSQAIQSVLDSSEFSQEKKILEKYKINLN